MCGIQKDFSLPKQPVHIVSTQKLETLDKNKYLNLPVHN